MEASVSSSSFSLGLLFFLYTYYSQKHVFSIFSKDSEDIANLRESHFQENKTMTVNDHFQHSDLQIYLFRIQFQYTNYRVRWSLTLPIICLSFYWLPLSLLLSPSFLPFVLFPFYHFSLPFLLSISIHTISTYINIDSLCTPRPN